MTANAVPFTASPVDLRFNDNETWQDAFQFGVVGDTTWNMTNCTFHMDVKGSRDDVGALFSLTSANGRIILDDPVLRVLHFNATQADVQAALHPGRFWYDLVMLNNATPPIRTVLMLGRLRLRRGITQT